MALIKCKMCGGDLEITEGATVATCEYCGTTQTVPSADNEKKLTLFARANRFRFANEFDKASVIYENIVAEFPKEAEAYWGLVLCRYGIEYVDDPATGKKIPTCHRSSFDSVMEDGDFKQACENADVLARRVYHEEATAIEELRKGILEVSGKEDPYDIFICYKETAEDGQRTLDSVIAQDVYDALTEKGYRVFFSRISLEDKLGTEYEPYIFAALNSAKVMLAFGTSHDYFNATWVKNEWSRYLKLMAQDKGKHLIPCYKDIDAYDMPDEFARLQAQDMGKVGATQDLLRGIGKLIPREAAQPQQVVQQVISNGRPNTTALLKRGQMALEDQQWGQAKGFFNQILNMDAECAEAYLGLAMVAAKASTQEKLLEYWTNEDDYSSDLQRAQKYGGQKFANFFNQLEKNRTEWLKREQERREREKEQKQREKLALADQYAAEGFENLKIGQTGEAKQCFLYALSFNSDCVAALYGMTEVCKTSTELADYYHKLEKASPEISEIEKQGISNAGVWGPWAYLLRYRTYNLSTREQYIETICDTSSGAFLCRALLFEWGNEATIKTLLNGKIDLNSGFTKAEIDGEKRHIGAYAIPPLIWAVFSCAHNLSSRISNMKMLLEHGAVPNPLITGQLEDGTIIERFGLDYLVSEYINAKDKEGLFECIKLLLQNGADPNSYYRVTQGGKITQDYSAFAWAVRTGDMKLIDLFLQFSPNPRARFVGFPGSDAEDSTLAIYVKRRSKIFGPSNYAGNLDINICTELTKKFKSLGWL